MPGSKSSTKFLLKVVTKSSHRLLALSFLPLHFSIWNQDDHVLSKTLFLVHIGLFLLWQPFISHKTQIQTRPTIIMILALVGIIYLAGGWAQIIWMTFLVGILSSYRLSSVRDKLIFLLIISYLLIELFGGLIPQSMPLRREDLLIGPDYINYLSLAIIVLAMLLPAKHGSFRNYSSDLLYSLIAISVVVLIAMATLLWMTYGGNDYFVSLFYAFMMLSAVLIVFNLIFGTSSEIGLAAQFRDRYLLNLGTPFESFLIDVAELGEKTEDPESYLQSALELFCSLDWVSGSEWRTDWGEGSCGDISNHKTELRFEELKIILYSVHPLGPAMKTHAQLLAQLVEIFYTVKRREITLSRSAHMEAIYETGARLTHDIKNLLQSLTLMLSAADIKPRKEENDKLFFKNLEIITQRLQQTLSKLRNPETFSEHMISLHNWWTEIKQRETDNRHVVFTEEITEGIEVPEELFNGVLDNLLDNAKKKQKREPQLSIRIHLISTLDTLALSVTDTGTPVSRNLIRTLLVSPVKSRSGFGIGLYQAAKQAQAHGFKLELQRNEEGNVCFLLRKT
ncbi:MAG TPA: ATP-binding protein [Gammaproteobacteria bacterium]